MQSSCSRRRALRLGGSLLAGATAAGCLGSDDSSTTTRTTATRTTTASTTTATTTRESVDAEVGVGESVALPDDTDLAVTDAWVQQSVVHLFVGAHRRVSAEPNSQFVLAHVNAERGYHGFALDVDGDVHPAGHEIAGVAVDGVSVEGRETEPLLLGWALPKPLDASDVAVVYESDDATIRWTAPDRVAATLSDPPAFEVVAFTAPETVAPNEPFDVSVTVENAGGSDGTFRTSMGRTDYSDQNEYRLDVPAGERVTHAENEALSGDADSVTYALDWGLDSLERTVNVEK